MQQPFNVSKERETCETNGRQGRYMSVCCAATRPSTFCGAAGIPLEALEILGGGIWIDAPQVKSGRTSLKSVQLFIGNLGVNNTVNCICRRRFLVGRAGNGGSRPPPLRFCNQVLAVFLIQYPILNPITGAQNGNRRTLRPFTKKKKGG